MAIYMLYDVDRRQAYLWTWVARDDPNARLKAIKLLEGATGHLFHGPTGKDEMEFLAVII